MTLKSSLRFGLVLAIAFSASSARAESYELLGVLNGLQEIPANTSTAVGTFRGSYDDVTTVLTWEVSYSGLTGAHPVVYGPALPGSYGYWRVDIGTLSGSEQSPIVGSVNLTTQYGAANAAIYASELLSQNWYIRIHTWLKPAGEIRGQIVAVPAPAVPDACEFQ